MKISLELLHILDAIERHGSFSAAATALHRVPSAISHAVSKLEDDLGFPLFAREGRKATLNPAGRTLLDDGRHLLHAAGELERRIQRIATGWEAELRIAVDMLIPVERLYPLLERFLAAGQATQIRLSYEVLGGTWDALATGRADLVLGAPGDLPPRGGIATRPLGEARLIPVVAPQHPLAAGPDRFRRGAAPPPGGGDCRHLTRVARPHRRFARRAGRTACPRHAGQGGSTTGGTGHWSFAALAGRPHLLAGRLCEIELAEPRPPTPYHVAWKSRHQGLALTWFLEALADEALLASLTHEI